MTDNTPDLADIIAGALKVSRAQAYRMMAEAVRLNAQAVPDAAAEFNRAIDFAIEQGSEAASFLRSWREGDVSEWPEFPQLLSAAVPQRDDFENFDAVLGRFEHKESGMLQDQMAAPQPAQAVPDGWALVPVEPTQQMKNAAQERCRAGSGMDWSGVTPQSLFGVAYKAMLSAAPAAPQPAPQPAQQPLTDARFQKIRRSLMRQSGWDGDGWDQALKEAIEQAHGIGVKNER